MCSGIHVQLLTESASSIECIKFIQDEILITNIIDLQFFLFSKTVGPRRAAVPPPASTGQVCLAITVQSTSAMTFR